MQIQINSNVRNYFVLSELSNMRTTQLQYKKLESQQKVFEEILLDILTKKQKLVKKYFQNEK
jgi:hypothetical protein